MRTSTKYGLAGVAVLLAPFALAGCAVCVYLDVTVWQVLRAVLAIAATGVWAAVFFHLLRRAEDEGAKEYPRDGGPKKCPPSVPTKKST